MEDKEILELIDKNKQNFCLLIEKYKDPLKRYINRISFFGDAEVEDFLQDIFIKVYINLNSFDKDLKFSSWIYRITHNYVVDKIRKNKNRTRDTSIDDESIIKILKSEEDIEKEIINKEEVDKVKNILNTLPDIYKEVLILRFIEEKSYEEIVDILKKPKGTIASIINKGRKIIKDKIKI